MHESMHVQQLHDCQLASQHVSEMWLRNACMHTPEGMHHYCMWCRWRLYRYDKGAVYRPHVDGAWPGSGIRDGHYVFDAYGDRWSR